MTRATIEPILTAVFVDYDNIYLSLKKRSEDAAKRFAKDSNDWIKALEAGALMTPTNSPPSDRPRRIVLNRCYGNPVPRRNAHDNSTDMNSFPFVRHHFLRAGFEVVDCPPLTAQLKNSSDIRMVMDVRDYLIHDTRFEEFIILSGDADFTPVLHRLRAHDRRTVIFANDFTAAPYRAIADAEIKESDLLAAILDGKIATEPAQAAITSEAPQQNAIEQTRKEIIAHVVAAVRSAGGPVPIEALAERTTRAIGHDRTVASGWAGVGSFLELLKRYLPSDIRLSDQPPYQAFEIGRMIQNQPQPALEVNPISRPEPALASISQPTPASVPTPASMSAPPIIAQPAPAAAMTQAITPLQASQPAAAQAMPPPASPAAAAPLSGQPAAGPIMTPTIGANALAPEAIQQPPPRQTDSAIAIQQSIARIHDACQAPPLSPPDYRALFEILAREINEVGLQGSQTFNNITQRATDAGIAVTRDDIRFIMDVVSEADPWFEQGASANLFAGRFRNFVVARCRSQGLNLSSDELDLIEAWFAGSGEPIASQGTRMPPISAQQHRAPPAAPQRQAAIAANIPGAAQNRAIEQSEEFPKILRTRLRN